ncbi:hypothetical protein [Streptomyces sp. NPDC000134]|uniref:hypothetical protein n=1 Tax=Streptomyces sp. NPDC000134 TaxID=3364536 RepID=UPI00347A829C
MKLVVLGALVVLGVLVFGAIRRARAEDVPLITKAAVTGVIVLVLGALSLLLADPADLPVLLHTAVRALR